MSLYPMIDEAVRAGCVLYKRREISLDDIKQLIWKSAQDIVSLEDRTLRAKLMNAESELDLIQFTVNSHLVFDESLAVIARVEQGLGDLTDRPEDAQFYRASPENRNDQ